MSCDENNGKHFTTLLECEYETLKDSEDSFSFLICPICQDQFETPILQCSAGHAFCKPCIEFWLSRKSNCPSCRKSITKSSLGRNLVLEQAIEELIVRHYLASVLTTLLKARNLVPKNQAREKKCFLNNSVDNNCSKVSLMAILSPWNIFSFIVTVGFLLFLARDISLAFVERHHTSVQPSSPPPVVSISPTISYTNVCNVTPPAYVEKPPQIQDEDGHLPLSKVMEELGYHAYHAWKNVLQWKKTRSTESLVLKLRGQLRPIFDWVIDIAEVVGKTMMYLTVEIIKWIVIFVVMLVDFAYTAAFLCLGLVFEMFEAQI